MLFEDDNLFILILITLGICFIMDVGWLEQTLVYEKIEKIKNCFLILF